MFLFTITKEEIAQNFDTVDVEESKIDNCIITSITDNFLSKRIFEKNGISILESPLVSEANICKIIFSKFSYNTSQNTFTISKSTISGRPIYYYLNSNNEFFCSTHISMLRKAGVPIQENIDVLPEFFIYRIVMPPRTLYKNIKQLCSGEQIQIKILNEKCVIQSVNYFNLPTINQNIISIQNVSKEMKRLLIHSIESLSSRKEEIAPLLSGGLDSSILCRICQENLGSITSYSTGYPFEDPSLNNEKIYALSAGKILRMDHHYYESTSSEYLRGFLDAISLSEQPLHHLQMICLHLLYKKGIPHNKKIVVEGWGAGGSFGNFRNYLFYKDKIPFKLIVKKPFQFILKFLPKISDLGEKSVDMLLKSTLNIPLSDPNHPVWSSNDYGDKNWVCRYLNVSRQNIINGQYDSLKRFENNSIFDIVALYSLLGDEDVTLSILSKICEGNQKILYVPFYDYELLQYVLSIPWKLKLKRPENILRKSLARECNVPSCIINRPKAGFGIQEKRWSEKGGIFDPMISIASKVFDEKEIRNMQSSEPTKAMTFWNILNYSIWKRLHIYNEPLEILMEELNKMI
jgi:asparagine synthetase B (glutamine-hydrolysing)